MTLILSVVMLAATTPATEPCLGVAIEGQHGPINLMGFSATGDKASVEKLAAANRAIGGETAPWKDAADGRVTAHFFFPSPPVRADAAVDLVVRARRGAFGRLAVETATMGIETLPADKCPR